MLFKDKPPQDEIFKFLHNFSFLDGAGMPFLSFTVSC